MGFTMGLKRRQVAIILSVMYLGVLTILAAYASHSSDRYSIPISNALTALTLALPPVAGLTIETSNALATALANKPKHRRVKVSTIPPILLPGTVAIATLLIYQTAIATLAATKIGPVSALTCGLHDKWQELFRDKNEKRIKRIQDAFQCCGLTNPRDMGWPFPDGKHGADACRVKYGSARDRGCLAAWRGEERKLGAIMLIVAIGVFLWMAVVIATPVAQPKKLRGVLSLPPPNADGDEAQHRALEYERYRDEVEEEGDDDADDGRDETSIRRAITNLNSQSNLASLVEGNRSRPSVLTEDINRWRDS